MSPDQQKKIYSYSGNELVVKGAIAAGCNFFAGYPISPSSEIAAGMAAELPKRGHPFVQMEDEIAGMAATIGGSLAGRKAMTATSGPGFSLKQENLGFACMTEVPCVVVNVMRAGPSTGMPTFVAQGDLMQARWGTHGDHWLIVLAPAYHNEIYYETIRAFNLAEKYRTPVVLLTDEILAHMSGRLELPENEAIEIVNRKLPKETGGVYKPYEYTEDHVPPLAPFFAGYRFHVTGLTHDEFGLSTENTAVATKLMDRLQRKFTENLDDILKWETFMADDADVLIVTVGSSGRSAKQAVLQLRSDYGIKAGLFRPITLWPFPEEALKQTAVGKSRVIVAEMNMGQMALEVERLLHRDIEFVGRANGEMLSPEDIVAKIIGKSPVLA